MKHHHAIIREIYQTQEGHSALIEFERAFVIAPGQYLQLWREADQPYLAEITFPAGLMDGKRLLLDRIPQHWSPGDEIRVTGPLGRGFELPAGAHNVLLACVQGGIYRLMPLAELALAQGASVAVCIEGAAMGEGSTSTLPSAIEVQPLEALPEMLSWADYLAIDLHATQLPMLQELLGDKPFSRALAERCQVLVRKPMPCADHAECGVCAITTPHGQRLVCRDGPVFLLKVLIHVAG